MIVTKELRLENAPPNGSPSILEDAAIDKDFCSP